MSAARNVAIRNARGTYIAFLDADDQWLPEKLSRQVDLMESRPEIGFCSTAARVEDGEGRLLNLWRCHHGNTEMLVTLFSENAAIAGGCSSVMVRKHLVDRVGLFDESLRGFEDPDLWIRLAAVSGYQCIDEPLVVILRREHSVSRNLDAMRVSTLRSMRKNRVLLPVRMRGRFWRELPRRRLYGLCEARLPRGPDRQGLCGHAAGPVAVPRWPWTALPRTSPGLPAWKARMTAQPLDALLFGSLVQGAQTALLVAAVFSAGLLIKSILDFTRTGPELAEEVLAHYRVYLAYSLARLFVFALPDYRLHGVRRHHGLCGGTAAARRRLSAGGGGRCGGRRASWC